MQEGGGAEKSSLSAVGKNPPDEPSQTMKHRNIHFWLHRWIPGPAQNITSKYLEIVSMCLKLFLKSFFPLVWGPHPLMLKRYSQIGI